MGSFEEKGSLEVSVEVTETNNNTDLTLGYYPNSYTFYVTGAGDAEYTWYIDGVEQEGKNDSSFTLDVSEIGEGTYIIQVVAGDLSASRDVYIGASYGDVAPSVETESTIVIEDWTN